MRFVDLFWIVMPQFHLEGVPVSWLKFSGRNLDRRLLTGNDFTSTGDAGINAALLRLHRGSKKWS